MADWGPAPHKHIQQRPGVNTVAGVKSGSSWRVRDDWGELGLVEEGKAFQAGGTAKAKACR